MCEREKCFEFSFRIRVVVTTGDSWHLQEIVGTVQEVMSVKASLRDPGSLKEAFTDFALGRHECGEGDFLLIA
ncbi:hypothetical protein CFP71_00445 [Amycolatopsis thailandensis]|uniref:Uncharacterized protein n=1 Tax=Amycolatopsis thailandensis TaxID=589330 RepID=A0A229SJE9_9PSEU|nr:hypothetical protein CFP71_00445 [Amycolatopsis thailandensis]